MLYYKIDVLEALKKAGYNTNRLRKEKLIAEGTLQHIRRNEMVNSTTIDVLCNLLDMQPGEIIGFRRE